jgi:hypothetical protein
MKALCINLPSRQDRWGEFIKQPFPFEVEQVPGVIHQNGSIGCIMAHQKAMRQFDEGLNLLMEDDCKLIEPWSTVEKAIEQLPTDWDILYLGAMLHTPLKRYSHNLYHLQSGWGNHGIIYNGRKVADLITSVDPTLINSTYRNIDTWMVYNVLPFYKCYIVYPLVAIQAPGYSDITKRQRDYKMIEHYTRYTQEASE